MTKLFSPIIIDQQTLENRVIIPPMCQYSAIDGKPTDWHKMHYGSLSHSGAGLLIFEATSICPDGRLSPYDLGIWDDETEAAMSKLIKSIRKYSAIPLGIQLVHAGRKASMPEPWKENKYITPQQGGWKTVAPSAIAYDDNHDTPKELTTDEIKTIIKQFAEAAKRADDAGFDMIEIHGAHGYLIHQFLSPLSNKRTDEYGGPLENRIRFAVEIFKAIRKVVSMEKAVGIRISATDWVEGGWDLEQSIALAKTLKDLGCSFIDVSTGALHKDQKIPVGPNYQVPFAQAIKEQVAMPTMTVGLITEATQAQGIIGTGQADMVAIGRGMLYNPHWAWQAAAELGAQVTAPPQYLRCQPHQYKNLFK
ncbi:NADH:flavin oxidoreductase/NADH oxidase [Entomomonas sp. E2T0]|uniref:NADH:flavin oxidoreductase/NADH oxidase n=1 Tax=Entomomonas sp. E2T0 TaxID=2930213 RepID=UPI0022282E05|nr:NADH:flavin oxidoreductase/NADH oxidase [Entomomonas sp. E2T0]UYZ84091.1 NADH:flavin oxidoreductase/NADH oxidase [Entomomonas sp. E2T0]